MVESNLSTKVQLFISGRSLKDLDSWSKSDPYCSVSIYDSVRGCYVDFSRTEVLKDNLNPDWTTAVELDYYFEINQPLLFVVYDYDSSSSSEEVGRVETTLGHIVGAGTAFLNLKNKKFSNPGKLIVRAEELRESREIYFLQFKGKKLDKKDFFGKSDPYLVFYRLRSDGQWLKIHSTEIIKSNLNPIWQPFEITSQKLCNGDPNCQIKIECWDWDRNSSHDFIGEVNTTVSGISIAGVKLPFINKETQSKKKNYQNSGELQVAQYCVKREYSFIDYLRGGTQFRLVTAVDFTASNGEYSDPHSLHHINPNQPNEYQRAMWAVGSILDNYDSQKYYPVFGFGGKPRTSTQTDHCFPLNGNRENPFVPGVYGIMQAYETAQSNISLSGPTLFQHVLRSAIAVAQSTPPQQVYYVLMILTDGEIHDMRETKSLVVEASSLPLSIIIVGVGNENFRNMEALDSDEGLLRDDNGRFARRDIVQFVPFKKFGGNPQLLAKEVLAEIPKQITGYMKMIGHEPVFTEQVPMNQLGPSAPEEYQ